MTDCYIFDPYELRDGKLFVGDREIEAERQVLQLIELLVNSEGAVSTDDIKRAIWPTKSPPDSALHNLVSKARRVLAECPENAIIAMRGAGYRFGVQVERRRSTSMRIVGRSRELADLHELVGTTRPGLQLVLVTGPAGSGKTTLVQEFAHRLEQSAARCAFGRCFDGSEAPPFWPWQELWSVLFPADGGLTDGIFELEDSSTSEHPMVGGAERRRLAHRILSRLREASDRNSLVLVLDDIHLVGEETLELLSFLCSATSLKSVSVVATRRPATQSKARQALERLERHARGFDLEPLGPRSSLELVRAACPTRLSDAEERDLLERANGNPLFLKELARIAPGGDVHQLPALISAAIDDHLRSLPAHVRHVLHAAALIGERFELRLVAQCVRLRVDEVTDTLNAAVPQDVVRLPSIREGEFTHALYQQRLAETQDPASKRRAHRALAETLGAEGALTSPNRLGAIARHLALAAESPEDWLAAATASERAGDGYAVSFAYETASEHYENALEFGARGDGDGRARAVGVESM